MNKYLLATLTSLFLFSYSSVFAQQIQSSADDKNQIGGYEDKTVKNEIGFDMTYFLNLFRPHSAAEGTGVSIFSIAYSRELSEKISLRTTVGIGYTNSKTERDTMPTIGTLLSDDMLKAGIAWKTKSYRRWQFYYGVDFSFENIYQKIQQPGSVTNSVTENINKSLTIGPGPFLGIFLYLNPRISLSLETNMNVVYSVSSSKADNPLQPELNSNTKTTSVSTVFTPPSSIFLNMKF